MALLGVLGSFEIPSQRDKVIAEVEKQQGMTLEEAGLSPEFVDVILYGALVTMVIWAIVAAVLALLTMLGHNWARITLAVSAAAAGALSLLASFGGPAMLPLVVLVGASLWLLLRPETAIWFRRH